MDRLDAEAAAALRDVWVPVGLPGFAGEAKHRRWRPCSTSGSAPTAGGSAHLVRGRIVSPADAIVEYEEAYRRFLRDRPALVRFLVDRVRQRLRRPRRERPRARRYDQPDTIQNHYQDISVRRVIAELVDDPAWPDVVDDGPAETVDMVDLGTGEAHAAPARARVPGRSPAADPRPDVARLRAQPGGRAGPRPVADHDRSPSAPSGTTRRAADTSLSRPSGR